MTSIAPLSGVAAAVAGASPLASILQGQGLQPRDMAFLALFGLSIWGLSYISGYGLYRLGKRRLRRGILPDTDDR